MIHMAATTITTRSRATTPQPPRKRSPERSAAVLVRMPELYRRLLQHAADARGVSLNDVVLEQLTPFFIDELKEMNGST